MTELFHVTVELFLVGLLIIHDRRIAELEERLNNLNERHARLARRAGNPYN